MGISWKIALVGWLSLAAVSGGFYFYYNHTQEQIIQLNKNNALLEAAVKEQNSAIARMQQNWQFQVAENTKLQNKLRASEQEKDIISEKLSKHDLGELGKRKPGLIENIINKGTQDVFDDFENITTN